MKSRCLNVNTRPYDLYGGRGIKIHETWINNFQQFLLDLGFAPSIKHELDRIDVNSNYEKSNCRWATRKEQMRNTRVNNLILYNNKTLTVIEWSELTGVNPKTIYTRKYAGWTDKECIEGKNYDQNS